MFIRSVSLSFLYCMCSFGDITHSVIPTLEEIENSELEKFSDHYIQEVNRVLTRQAEKIRIVTYNILFDVFDNQLQDKSLTWLERHLRVVESIENMKPDILCLQESYPAQINDLMQSLGDHYSCFIGSKTTGELNGIFYNKERFELILTDPQGGSISASLDLPLNPKDEPRVAKVKGFLSPELEPGRQMIVAHFHDKLTNKSFVVINTHLTFYRVNSREDQSNYIVNLAKQFHAMNKFVIVTGDLNTFPNRPDHLNYGFYDGDYICNIFRSALKDTREAALMGHLGPLCTSIRDFTRRGDKPFDLTESPGLIQDHIYVSPGIDVIINAIEPCQVNSRFPSDHLPVIADIILP